MSSEIKNNTKDSHQTSPSVVLTFVRWSVRDSFNTTAESFDVRKPLVVYSDCISLTVSDSKSNKNSQMQAVLTSGDLNYATAINTGDFVFVNMLDWEQDAEKVAIKALDSKPINGEKDGFKGFYRIRSVSRRFSINEEGVKTYFYTITGSAFTEFDTVIVFNPAIANALNQEGFGLFPTLVGDYYSNKVKTSTNVTDLISDLFDITVGKHLRNNDPKIPQYGNKHYKIPILVGALLGIKEAKYVNEVYNLILGVWPNSPSGTSNLSQEFNPILTNLNAPNKYITNIKMQGDRQIAPENWNQKTAWSIMLDNLNVTLNEMYTCFRIDPKSSKIMPTIIARQKPFTSNNFNLGNYNLTKYLKLPRWKLSPEAVMEADFYRNQELNVNFVQVFTRSLAATQEQDMADQISLGNIVFDSKDIERQGMKPYITSSNFDFPANGQKTLRATDWTKILADWLVNGHLKESGTIVTYGIQEPIAVGDNIEFDNIVYHIEGVNHAFQVARSGKKTFKTTIHVSYGVDKRSNNAITVYPEMEYTDRYSKGVEDYNHEKILPGFSDTQDIIQRREFNGEEVVNTKEETFMILPSKRKKE